MTGEPALRALAGSVALAGGRSLAPWRLGGAGLLLGAAVFGLAPRPAPAPLTAAVLLLVLAALFTLMYEALWSPIVSEAALSGLWLSVPAALAAASALRAEGRPLALAGGGAVLAALSLFVAQASIGNAEAGWRRAAHWTFAVALPGLEIGRAHV